MKISEKNIRNLIRKNIISEVDILGWLSPEDEEDEIRRFNWAGDTGTDHDCPELGITVDSWRDVHPGLIKGKIITRGEIIIVVDGIGQNLVVTNGVSSKKYRCSTGAKGFGNQPGSEKTSTGLMEISGHIGEGQPTGMVFKGLSPTNYVLGPNEGKKAWVLTRALLLRGLQPENKNVRSRAIYIHGTNRERNLGKAASGGCIRVSSENILSLFNLPTGMKVYVLGEPISSDPSFPCEAEPIRESSDLDLHPQGSEVVYGEPNHIDPDSTA